MTLRTKWEYLAYTTTYPNPTEALAAFGEDCWELVSVHPYSSGWRFFFKRPVEES